MAPHTPPPSVRTGRRLASPLYSSAGDTQLLSGFIPPLYQQLAISKRGDGQDVTFPHSKWEGTFHSA